MQSPRITLISTVHKEIGKCNSFELSKIIESLKPDVIFLEAFEKSYTNYHNMLLSQFDVYQERLEIKAIQIYSQKHTFKYVPVLDIEKLYEFEAKLEIVSNNKEYRCLIDTYISLESELGFPFINSEKQNIYQEKMREMENRIIDNNVIHQKAHESIDAYEHSMLRNIYFFCKDNSFDKAIFMCGVGHRKSITQKIKEYETKEKIKLDWKYFNDTN